MKQGFYERCDCPRASLKKIDSTKVLMFKVEDFIKLSLYLKNV
jgi:hypothetical protein